MMIPALSQVCALGSPFETDLVEFKAAGFDHAECWITKLEAHLGRNSVESTRRLLAEMDIQLPVGSFQGGLLSAPSEGHDPTWLLFRQRLGLLPPLGIRTLVVAADLPHPLPTDALAQVLRNLAGAAELAGQAGVRLALEFHPRSAFITNLQTAAAAVQQIQHPALGICLDTFHFQIGPSKLEDLELLTSQNLFHVQVADVADLPRELAGDADRIVPTDGNFDWRALVQRLREISYTGLISMEVMNPRFARISAAQMADVARRALDNVLAAPDRDITDP